MKVVRFEGDPLEYVSLGDAGAAIGKSRAAIWKLVPVLEVVCGVGPRREGKRTWVPVRAVEALREPRHYQRALDALRESPARRQERKTTLQRLTALEREVTELRAELRAVKKAKTKTAKAGKA